MSHAMSLDFQIARKEIDRLRLALKTIAEGNVPPGFLENIENETKPQFQERFNQWLQQTARNALSA